MPRPTSKPSTALYALWLIPIIGAVALIVIGAIAPAGFAYPAQFMLAGLIGLLIVSVALPFVLLLSTTQAAAARRREALLREQGELLNQIHEHTMLSDSARHIAYRKNERAMLRRAIEEDMNNEDWQAAIVLVDEMRERFGYREEAEEYLDRIERAQSDLHSQRITEALEHFHSLLASKDWPAAYADAARLTRLYPESHRTRDLENEVRQARLEHQKSLEREFLDAASRNDIDHAMQLLRDLDAYLSPQQAAPLQEVARGVVSKARDNIGLQFKLAVRDHDWDGAVRIGETIMDEFPNTRMAEEVRDRIDIIRQRAAQTRSVNGLSPIDALTQS